MKKFVFGLFCFFVALTVPDVHAQAKSMVGIDENLGGYLPMQSKVVDETGKTVLLKDIINKPTILMFVYFECPGLCTPLMSEIAAKVSKLDLEPGKDYQVVSLSFDPTETAPLAAGKKKNYLHAIGRPFPEDAWRFLTADSAVIKAITDSAGFRYKKEGDAYIHAGAIIMISPDGKITRYLLGTEFLPFDMKMGLIEAAEGRPTPTIAKVLQFCFKYDAQGRKYALNVTRVFGTIIILGAIAFVLVLTLKKKKTNDAVQKS
jgi:protein SCO1/2